MADPIIVDHYHAMVVMQPAGNADPRNRFINNFYFRSDVNGRPFVEVADEIDNALTEFYNTNTTGTASHVANFLAPRMDPTAQILIYDLGQAPPRDPQERAITLALPSDASTSDLPSQLAICCSYGSTDAPRTAASTTENPVPRRARTGRIFIGPLQNGCIDTEPATGFHRGVLQVVVDTIAEAADRLATNPGVTPHDVTWVMLSQVLGQTFEIDYGWVDNEFDTMRSRDLPATYRNSWTV